MPNSNVSWSDANSQAAVTSGLSDLQNHDGYRGDATVGEFGSDVTYFNVIH